MLVYRKCSTKLPSTSILALIFNFERHTVRNPIQCNLDYAGIWGGPNEVVSIPVCFYKELRYFIW